MRYVNLASILLLFAAAAGLYWGAYFYFKTQELEKAAARLTLYRGTVQAELQHFAHLPFLLSQDPFVVSTLSSREAAPPEQALRPLCTECRRRRYIPHG